jgi:hypothetical protein
MKDKSFKSSYRIYKIVNADSMKTKEKEMLSYCKGTPFGTVLLLIHVSPIKAPCIITCSFQFK